MPGLGLARLGSAWPGQAGQGLFKEYANENLGLAWRGEARHGWAGQGQARQGLLKEDNHEQE